MKEVSNDFLDFKKSNFPEAISEKIEGLFKVFKKNHKDGKKSVLNIVGLSCRARIFLLKKIMDKKRKKLPESFLKIKEKNVFNSYFDNETINTVYWKSESDFYRDRKFWKVLDKLPTTFEFGEQLKWTLTYQITFDQPGNAMVTNNTGLPCKYKAICLQLDNKNISVQEGWGKILKQKKDGIPIKMQSNDDCANLLNFYSFLLDFEIARRKVEGDIYESLPLITCFPFLMGKRCKTYEPKNGSYEKKELGYTSANR